MIFRDLLKVQQNCCVPSWALSRRLNLQTRARSAQCGYIRHPRCRNTNRNLEIKAEVVKHEAARPGTEEDHVRQILADVGGKQKVMIAQVAPAVRVSLGEEFNVDPPVTGKIVTALKLLGYQYVFDVIAGADLTILEEGSELIQRLADTLEGKKDAAPLPMFTSCCPGWIEFVEKCSPEVIPYVSTAKSPHMMQGAIIKTFFSDVIKRPEEDISVTSVMPCVRKQGEADREPNQTPSGHRHVDHVITTKGLAQMVKDAGIDFANLPDSHFDAFMGLGSGGAVLFGTSGGVTEAALRTVYDIATQGSGAGPLDHIEFEDVRGMDGIKETSLRIPANPEGPLHNSDELELRVCVCNGLGNAKKLLKETLEGESKYHFVEVMACPGGCIGGGGQPRSKGKEVLLARQKALYNLDSSSEIRKSHENPVIKDLYTKYLVRPGSDVAEELLHTGYVQGGASQVKRQGATESSSEDLCDAEDI